MPRPLRPCAHPDCPTLTRATRCPTHTRDRYRQQDATRGTAAQRGYNAQHQRHAKRQTERDPRCARCHQTRTEVEARGDHLAGDHIIPLSAGGTNTPANYRTLCGHCNSSQGGTNRLR